MQIHIKPEEKTNNSFYTKNKLLRHNKVAEILSLFHNILIFSPKSLLLHTFKNFLYHILQDLATTLIFIV